LGSLSLPAGLSHFFQVRQLLLDWYDLPPFLCGLAHLSANFIRGRPLGGIHFAKRFR
jgi:hypothetical protein